MTAKEFAIEYMGRKVKLYSSKYYKELANWVGEVVGYRDSDINDSNYDLEGYVYVKSINPNRSYIQSHKPNTLIVINEDKVDLSRYPQTCPKCGGPAYIGALQIDCFNGC